MKSFLAQVSRDGTDTDAVYYETELLFIIITLKYDKTRIYFEWLKIHCLHRDGGCFNICRWTFFLLELTDSARFSIRCFCESMNELKRIHYYSYMFYFTLYVFCRLIWPKKRREKKTIKRNAHRHRHRNSYRIQNVYRIDHVHSIKYFTSYLSLSAFKSECKYRFEKEEKGEGGEWKYYELIKLINNFIELLAARPNALSTAYRSTLILWRQ